MQKSVFRIQLRFRSTLAGSLAVIGHSWDLDQKRNGTELTLINPTDPGIEWQIMLNFSDSDHLIFRASSAFEKGELRSKGGGKKTVHFNGSNENIELLLRTVVSANHLSVYGAVAELCREVSKDIMASVEETMEIPTELPTADPRTDEQRRGNLLQEYEQKSEQLFDYQKLSKLCSDAGLKTVERGHYFITLDAAGGPSGMVHLCREYTLPRNDPRT